jgi:hypothetical protein
LTFVLRLGEHGRAFINQGGKMKISKLAPMLFIAAVAGGAHAGTSTKQIALEGFLKFDAAVPKSAFASTVASRAYSSASNTVYGGFELASSSTVYILVRGNSLGSLGITNGYLDAPHVRLFNSAGQDLISQNGFVGFNDCSASNTSTDLPVINYYAGRGIPVNSRDTCLATFANAGSYTFTVTPSFLNVNSSLRASGNSGPSNGEILFEVKLGP